LLDLGCGERRCKPVLDKTGMHYLGLDVMGDGSLVPFRGGVSRKEVSAERDEAAYDAVAKALQG